MTRTMITGIQTRSAYARMALMITGGKTAA
jgi:hypothetical protein